MKKILIICFCIVIMTSLGACKSSAIKAVEQSITAIGIVSIDSEKAILEAENAYTALSDRDKAKVSNYGELIAARTTYNAIPKPIELTIDNYLKYLDFGVNAFTSGMPDGSLGFRLKEGVRNPNGGIQLMLYGCVYFQAFSKPRSSNYEFSDVVIELKFNEEYKYIVPFENNRIDTEKVEMPLTVNIDIAGNGYAEEKMDIYQASSKHLTFDDWLNTNCEIVSISGTVIEK